MSSDALKVPNAANATDAELDELATKYYGLYPNVKIIVYKGTTLNNTYLNIADALENFEVRDDDVWIAGHSKCGTSWVREMVWKIVNNLDLDTDRVLNERCPLLEYSGLYAAEAKTVDDKVLKNPGAVNNMIENSLDYFKTMPSPRCIGTHHPYHLLPRQLRSNETKSKIVYVARNPKDVCISYYHFLKLTGVYTGEFEGFLIQSPFWQHVSSYWERRNDENVLFLKYEDMKTNLRREIKRTVEFLGKNYSDEEISKLEEHLSFANMKKNPAMNRQDLVKVSRNPTEGSFLRKGQVGEWKTVMSSEMREEFDKWTRENLKDNPSLLREGLASGSWIWMKL